MNILYCGDVGISRGALVSILSILKYNSGGKEKPNIRDANPIDNFLLHNSGDKEKPSKKPEVAKKNTTNPVACEERIKNANHEPINFYIMTIDNTKITAKIEQKIRQNGASEVALQKLKEVRPFTERSAKFLDKLVKKTNLENSVILIDATEIFVQNLPRKNMGSLFTPCSMLRLYVDHTPELAKCDRLLYLDYDVMCRGDLSGFYHTDMAGIEAAGVLDMYGRHWYHYRGLLNGRKDVRPKEERIKSGGSKIFYEDYMNSGVMLFNMKQCQKSQMFSRAVEICQNHKMLLADQAALNKAITHRKLMPRKYNEQDERPHVDTVLHHFSNNFKFWPYFRVQKVKPYDVARVHSVLEITEYDDIFAEFEKLKNNL